MEIIKFVMGSDATSGDIVEIDPNSGTLRRTGEHKEHEHQFDVVVEYQTPIGYGYIPYNEKLTLKASKLMCSVGNCRQQKEVY